ncbi:Phage shock protein PspC (stress-responsive transcriptional regulator) [Friedmanniella luteola]|uniref:Phage shock protein PspC (Stress-responsive transcriptional regulator) n=1 Tax=Friedmanniella luteola TaxID=546871 RepID=A0A1H1YSW0_9ACTN|nr:PspC domain-containing protein [Friedmanniella luteola]SDT24507.1 Phage shock protein PspC (stress-responsive transcriptional regulator) [Friedmanniella luteola]
MNHPTPGPKRLTRSRDDRVVAGVCGGLARYLNMDASLVRILTVVLTLVTSGAALVVYAIAVLVVPEDERVGPGAYAGPPPVWQPPQPPAPAPGPAPQDPVWGREGAPWEQAQASSAEPTGWPPAPGGTSAEGGDSPTEAGRPDAR